MKLSLSSLLSGNDEKEKSDTEMPDISQETKRSRNNNEIWVSSDNTNIEVLDLTPPSSNDPDPLDKMI